MKVTLLNEPNPNFSATQQIMFNRGISDLEQYIYSTDETVSNPTALGKQTLDAAVIMVAQHIQKGSKTLVVVDADNDGYTSAAILLNYFSDIFPSRHFDYFLHSKKQHGLSDCIDIAMKYDFVILPDSSSEDYEYHTQLKDAGKDVLVLDHHQAKQISPNACVINNQLCDYPNKELSGAGVVYQFCKYMDSILGKDYADNYLDLVACGLMGDMMSMTSTETKHLIFKGFRAENIKNPFLYEMYLKNKFSLSKADYKPSDKNGLLITPMGAAFFIVPFVNAITRSGTLEEKNLVFSSMLKYEAFKEVPSTKRGHTFGEMERIVDQALRTCTNVKNRQTKSVDLGMELLEKLIVERNLLQHKVLLFLLEPGVIDRNIAGLCANKIMSKYQRPCCVLTKVEEEDPTMVLTSFPPQPVIKLTYQGSARGYGKEMDFKAICSESYACDYAKGHENAFGLSIKGNMIDKFIEDTDRILSELSSEVTYFVDYSWGDLEVNPSKILEIADLNDYWGKDLDRAYVQLTNILVNQSNFTLMKSNTIKITLPDVSIIKFAGTEEEIEMFNSEQGVYVNMVCKCNSNEWNGKASPQLILEDYEVSAMKPPKVAAADTTQSMISSWGF